MEQQKNTGTGGAYASRQVPLGSHLLRLEASGPPWHVRVLYFEDREAAPQVVFEEKYDHALGETWQKDASRALDQGFLLAQRWIETNYPATAKSA